MADIDVETLTAQVVALTAAVTKLVGAKADAWDRPDPDAEAAREADLAAARAAKTAEIEAINAEIERRAQWVELPDDEKARQEAAAAARRYAEALADALIRKADPAVAAALAEGLQPAAMKAALTAVADELGEDHASVAAALRAARPK